ncbi:IS66 family insertion sequence element accessory protein TnpB [Sorangium sp. So ce385]|uniref:IS66 family insertion sequence element accessory protein TnpB n=1 Tax=Sorangium sp. So ce385 TaxID=3133308 RepID=UPI003F5C1DC8
MRAGAGGRGDAVLTLPPSVRVYVAAEPADLRKSFDGLSSLVAQGFGADPLCGHLFVFRNRRGDQIRVFFWDRTMAVSTSPATCPRARPTSRSRQPSCR